MAYKMKGFSYPGKAPIKSSPTKFIGGLSNILNMFKPGSEKSERGSLQERITNWQERKQNKMLKRPEDSRVNKETVEVEEEIKKDAYSIEGEKEEEVDEVEETEREQVIKK